MRGTRFDDDAIRSLVKNYNAAKDRKERRAALKEANIRRGNLQRMAAARGMVLFAERVAWNKGKRGGKLKRKRVAWKKIEPLNREQFALNSLLARLAYVDRLQHKLDRIKEILES